MRRRVVRLLTLRRCPLRGVVLLLLLLLVRGGLVGVCATVIGLRPSQLVRTGLLLLGRVFLSGELVWARMLLLGVFLSGELLRLGLLLLLVFLTGQLVWPGLWVLMGELIGCRRGRRHGHRRSMLLGVGCRLG